MAGSIYLRKDGRYEGRITTGKTADGKRIYRAFFGKTTEEVAEKMTSFRKKNISDAHIAVKFREIYLQWKQSIQYRIKESTLANYQMKAEKHILPVFGNCSIGSITVENAHQFVQSLMQTRLSNRYISDILVLMKAIFKFAVSAYQIPNPMDHFVMPQKPRPDVSLLTAKEQAELEQYINKHHNLATLGIAIAKTTGLRIGELCALQWRDIDLKRKMLTVRKTMQRIQVRTGSRKTKLIITEPKSISSCRQIPIPDFLIPFLREFAGSPEEYVCSGRKKPIEPRTMQYRFVRVLKNADLPSVHFHALRHMFASNCIKLGFDMKALSEILGHSSVEITMNIYVHSSLEQKYEYMNRLKMAV